MTKHMSPYFCGNRKVKVQKKDRYHEKHTEKFTRNDVYTVLDNIITVKSGQKVMDMINKVNHVVKQGLTLQQAAEYLGISGAV